MLKVENITKYYGDLKAVDDFSFTVNEGEIFGLLGANGAGKTTTFRIIMGLLDPNNGSVSLFNKPIDYTVTDQIGFLTEERSLLIKMTVRELMLFYGNLKGLKEKEIIERLKYWLDRFKISDYLDRKIQELSKGNQQKIQFISAIINEPKLLILDEPFTGLDPINVELFKGVIRELKNKGTIIIFSTHRMEHAEEFCEKLVILVRGKAVIDGYLKDIKKDFLRKNVFIRADVKKEDLLKVDGVLDVISHNREYEVKIKDKSVVDNLFKALSKVEKVTKFVVEEPSLNEIFIAKVGEAYER